MPLTRDRIIRAALDLIEREGEDGLSMRRVTAELDAGVMSLYNHVPSKAALLDGVAEYILRDMDVAVAPGTHWRIMRALLAYAIGAQMRETGTFPIFASRPDENQSLDRLDPAEFPHVLAHRDQILRYTPQADFEFGLDLLIDSLVRLAPENAPPENGG